MATAKFTARTYGNRFSAFITACNGVDKATADSAAKINAWASMAAAGIGEGKLTLDIVKAGIVSAYPKAKTLLDCGNTVKGRFYSLQRIINAGQGERLINGEALNTVAKDCKPKQEQKAGKRATGRSGKAKPRAITLETACETLVSWLEDGLKDSERALELARNADIALVVATIGKLNAKVMQATASVRIRKVAAGKKAADAKAKATRTRTRKAA